MKVIEPPSPPAPAVERTDVLSWDAETACSHQDALAVEEPLEIRLGGYRVAVTMRTPGHDFELATGFLYTEGIIGGPEDIASIACCASNDRDTPPDRSNIVNINPADPSLVDPARWQRHFFASSSCGICGKSSIESVSRALPPLFSANRVEAEVLYRLAGALRGAQSGFEQTGGSHAAGLFQPDGRLLTLREDVGRHNAVDKVVGHMLLRSVLPLQDHILMVSGRASFEVVQKALAAGIPVLAAVSAPSSLAVDLARSAGMTLVGFLRPGRFNVYAGEERIVGSGT